MVNAEGLSKNTAEQLLRQTLKLKDHLVIFYRRK